MAQPPQQQRPPPLLTPVEREALRRRHEAQEAQRQAQLAPSRPAPAPARPAPTPPQPPVRPSPQQQALDRGQNPPASAELEATGGVPGGSPLRQMEKPSKDAVVGNQGATAPEPVKTGPGNVQPPRWEPGDAAA